MTTVPGRTALGAALLAMTCATMLAAACGCGSTTAARPMLTILLAEYDGPQARAAADSLAQELASKGMADVFVVAGADHASLCLGRYSGVKDPRAISAMGQIGRVQDSTGQRPFVNAVLVPVPEAIPANPWPLEKAKGQYTLHVASWGGAGRYAAAQSYAAELRAAGYEAYVYHGPRLSMVTIGAFGPDIFDRPELVGQPSTKPTVTRFQGKTGPETHIEPGQPMAKPKITSPVVLALIKKFPTTRLGGELADPQAVAPTSLVVIPNRENEKPVAVARTYFDVDLAMLDVRTGLPVAGGPVTGRAQSVPELPAAAAALTRRLIEGLAPTKAVRIGVLPVMALNADAANGKADAAVLKQVEATLRAAGPDKIQFMNSDATLGLLDAAGLGVAEIMRDATQLSRMRTLDYLVVGSVTMTIGVPPSALPPAAPSPTAPAPATGVAPRAALRASPPPTAIPPAPSAPTGIRPPAP